MAFLTRQSLVVAHQREGGVVKLSRLPTSRGMAIIAPIVNSGCMPRRCIVTGLTLRILLLVFSIQVTLAAVECKMHSGHQRGWMSLMTGFTLITLDYFGLVRKCMNQSGMAIGTENIIGSMDIMPYLDGFISQGGCFRMASKALVILYPQDNFNR